MDQKSSMDRAQAVIAYLAEKCSVSVRHIVAPGAMARLIPWQSN
jgi:hypothetical protein